jgi:hypothetical protein
MTTTTTQDAGASTQSAGGEQGTTTAPANAGAADTTSAAAADSTTSTTTESNGTPGDAGAAAGEAKKEGGETEAIEYEVTAPEGIELDAASVDQFKALAKELNLPKDKAEQLAAIAVQREVARRQAFEQQIQDWRDQSQADPELGKDENLAAARKAIDTFGTPELKAMLDTSGLGNHPEVIRLAMKVGKLISEDSFVQANRPGAGAPKSLEERMYPTNATH